MHPSEHSRIRSIFHPTDYSEGSKMAFLHALRIAIAAKAELNMMHVDESAAGDWDRFPGVRETLERWNLIPAGSPRSAVTELGLKVRKVGVAGQDPVSACVEFCERHPAELVVLAAHQHEGRMRWLRQSVAKPVTRRIGETSLFIPYGVNGFVSETDGSISVRNILVPVVRKPNPQPAAEAALRFIDNLGLANGAVTYLYVGDPGEAPALEKPSRPGWTWYSVTKQGEPAQVILSTANEIEADLILMTTDGPDGFLDLLRGTTSERVLRGARCPIANIPAGAALT